MQKQAVLSKIDKYILKSQYFGCRGTAVKKRGASSEALEALLLFGFGLRAQHLELLLLESCRVGARLALSIVISQSRRRRGADRCDFWGM